MYNDLVNLKTAFESLLPSKKQNKSKQRKKEKYCHHIKFRLWTLRFEAL